MRGRKNIRLQDYDYRSDGYYFVTIVSRARKGLSEGDKRVLKEELLDIITTTKGTKLDYFIVMRNHVHVILILENSQIKLGEVIRRYKAKVARRLKREVWQANYYEHVIRNPRALNKIREYIINNPAREILKFDQFYSE